MSRAPTKSMMKALSDAAKRERANICPVVGVRGSAETVLLRALDAGGYIEWNGEPWHSTPYISRAGRAAVEAA